MDGLESGHLTIFETSSLVHHVHSWDMLGSILSPICWKFMSPKPDFEGSLLMSFVCASLPFDSLICRRTHGWQGGVSPTRTVTFCGARQVWVSLFDECDGERMVVARESILISPDITIFIAIYIYIWVFH